MMADHSSSRRRRSPGSSVGGRRKDRDRDSRRAPSEIVYEEPQRMRIEPSPSTNMPMPMPIERGVNNIAYGGHNTYLSSSNSSSSSFELVDISRSFPPKRTGLKTFFTAPSERRKLRRRRSSRLFKLNNSSSSSVNSDLAYGNGYIKRPKLRRVRSRSGKTMDRESARWSDRERERHRNNDGGRYSGSERRGYASGSDRRGNVSGSERRGNTEAEILAVGAGLAKLARDQNKHDLRSRNGRSPQVVAVKENNHHYGAAALGAAGAGALYGASRGLGNSKISHGSDTYDEDGWESASDAESENSVDSRLAFGAEAAGGWWGKEKHRPLSRKNTVVDPRLFGPENSLNGFVDRPVGFEEVTWSSSSDFGQQYRTYSESVGPNESFSGSQASLKHVFPVQSSGDPTRFEAARNSVASGSEPYISSRPGPAPLQPQPYTPVSQSLYNEPFSNISESPSILKRTSSSGKSNSVAQAALAGVAGVAVGAAIASSRGDDRKDKDKRKENDRDDVSRVSSKRRDDDRDDVSRVSSRRKDDERDDSSRVSLKRRDSDKKEGKDERRRDKRDNPDRDDRKDKKREKERKKEGSRYSDEERREKKRDKRREDAREETRDERREKRREERNDRRSEVATRPEIHYDDRRAKSEAAVSTVSAIDPMMFQVADDAFPTPTTSPQGHRRHESVPKVVTVEREPEFVRNRSSSIKDAPSSHRGDYFNEAEYDERGQRYQGGVSDHGLYNAETAFKEISHSTAPIAAGAIGVAAAIVAGEAYRESRSEKRRNERRQPSEYGQASDYGKASEYDDHNTNQPRGREPERDPIQEEADRAYREIVMARKIASQVIRSRSASPDGSVVGRYARKEEEEEVQIVTPPEMDHPKDKGPYDAPNADFQPDYQFDDPRQLRGFRPDQDRSSSGYLKRDPDAVKPRPLLNLVRPTPVPSPLPEKQKQKQSAKSETSRAEPSRSEPSRSEPTRSESGRSETARSEPPRSSKPRDRNEKPRTAVSEVASGPRGNGYSSPTASTVSKGVTWGENETKHFDVESPSDHHRDEYISSSDVPLFEKSPEPKQRSEPKSDSKPSKGWGAIAAGIIGAGVGVAATSSDTSTSKKSKSEDTEREKSPPNAYEYRGVIVEPESPPAKGRRQASPPSPGPKPTAQQSHMPGGFDDDLDFTAHVAAGLKDTGFDPNIVIDDPSFRRRDSPPGSNARGVYQAPFAETITDLGQIPGTESGISGSGFVMGEVAATPQDWRSISPEGDEFPVKLNKKEQKKRDKAKRQSSDSAAFDETPLEEVAPAPKEQDQDFYFNEPKLSKKEQKKRDKEAKRQSSLAEDVTPISEPIETRQIVDEPESYVETPKKSKKKSKRDSAVFDDDVEVASPSGSSIGRKISVPVDAFDDLRNEDDWDEPKKSKKKSKRDSERFDSPPRSAAASEISERSSSRKKDKSRSQADEYEQDPAAVSLPPSTPSEVSQDRDYDDSRRSRKSSSRDSGVFDHRDRSVVSETASRYDDEPRRKKKSSSRSSARDRDDFDDSRSVVSVASAPAGDEETRKSKKKEKEKKGSGFFGLFGSKSEVGARDESPKGSKDDFDDVKSKKKKKRSSMPDASSLYGDKGSQSVGDLSRSVSNGRSSHRYDDDEGARSDGERKKSRSRGDSSASKKDSFLGNAGTLGAGVGLAGAAVAIAAHQHQQSKANEASGGSERTGRQLERDDEFDPEITQRHFRPSIDPQYGDLLPLPPSEPATPASEEFGEFPSLPESRPHTPEEERLAKDRLRSSTRKHLQETPVKSPSQSAVPINFKMRKGNRSTPSSPGLPRATPLQISPGKTSPGTTTNESLPFSRNSRNRPTSWDSAKEYRPLYLPESVRRGSTVNIEEEEQQPLPELPASVTSSRSSSHLNFEDALEHSERSLPDFSNRFNEPLSVNTELASEEHAGGLLDSQQSTPKAKISFRDDESEPFTSKSHDHDIVAGAIAGVALAGAAAYLASSSHEAQHDTPPPIDPMSKDRSSYLLQSSPVSRKDDSSADYNTDSPSRGKSHLSKDSLGSIQEDSREQALKSLTGEMPVEDEPEEFSFSKSKKDKKEDKKKGKLSRSSTQDDISLSEPVVDATPGVVEVAAEAEPELLPLSKKDRKKGKKGKSATWEIDDAEPLQSTIDEPTADASKEIPEQPLEAEPLDDFSTPTKKGMKKDKKGKPKDSWEPEPDPQADSFELASGGPQIEVAAVNSTASRDLVEDVPDEVDTFDEFATSSKKKGKKDKKGKSKTALDPEPPLEEQALEATRDITDDVQPIPTAIDEVEFSTPKSRKDKKNKKGKDKGNWDLVPEQTVTAPEIAPESTDILPPPPTIDDAEDFSMPLSKKDKKKDKKKGKGSSTPIELPESEFQFTQDTSTEAGLQTPELVAAPAEEVFEESFTSKSKKDKKKDKKKGKSTAWEPEPESEIIEPVFHDVQDTDTADEFHDFSEENTHNAPEPSYQPALDLENVVPTEERSIELEQPKTEEVSEFSTPGSKKKGKKSKKAQSWDAHEETQPPISELEPSIEKFQTNVAETPDVFEDFATPLSKKGKKKKGKAQNWETEESPADFFTPPTSMIPRDGSAQSKDYFSGAIIPAAAVVAGAALVAAHHEKESNIEPESKPLVPDSKVEEQLNLAKQLREEFASGSKKSKKDKKKRQSLPATPDPEESRSRAVEEPSDVPIRARSLSIGPAADGDKPKLTFSEEQLEHARQMKEDFAKGSKKSKKGKNKRQDTGTWDDDIANQPVEGSPSRPDDYNPTQEVVDTTKANVLPTGYEESQLELARQMKVDFEKGSKKSKKDKKKRQDTSAWDDEPTVESPNQDVQVPEDIQAPETTEDASKREVTPILYPEDQLSLARQLQADFNKNSKKDKKRRSTSQTPQSEEPAEDYFGNHSQSAPFEEPQSYETTTPLEPYSESKDLSSEGPASRYNAEQLELARQMKEDFAAAASKKNKKDKKGKKRNTTDDDFLSQEPIAELADPLIADASTPQPEAAETSLTADPEDEFAFTSKKSKKDKKGKKRDTSELPMEVKEPAVVDVPAVVDSEDEFAFSSKKSKKDKKGKKRDSVIPAITDDIPSEATFQEATATDFSGSRETDTVTTPAETEDDFSFSSKKSKKDKKGKKRDSLPAVIDEPIFNFDEPKETFENKTDDTPQHDFSTAVEVEDEFAFPSKNSKKDKKKQKGSVAQEEITPEVTPPEESEPLLPSTVTEPIAIIEPPNDSSDDFGFSSKKSKKDKKKRGSLLRHSSVPSDFPDEPVETRDLQLDTTEDSVATPPPEVEDDFGFSSKKYKKGKKKGKAMQDFSPSEEPIQDSYKSQASTDFPEPSTIKEDLTPVEAIIHDQTSYETKAIDSTDTPTEATEDAFDDFAPTKKSKKKGKGKDSSKDVTESSIPLDEPAKELSFPIKVETQDKTGLDEPQASTSLDVDGTGVWDSFISTKKSKKDKKKGKNLPTESGETSVISTPTNIIEESSKDIVEPVTISEGVHDKETIVPEISRDLEVSIEESTTQEPEADGWSSFSAKPSKKDKKKRKSGVSTPIEEPIIVEESVDLGEPSSTIPAQIEEPEQDEWSAKPSKKDKKKNKGKSTPDEVVPEPIEAVKSIDVPDLPVTEPVQDEWSSFSAKPSKKDKKKNKSGVSTPIEVVPEESIQTEISNAILPTVEESSNSQDPLLSSTEDTAREQVDEWATPSKKSKKDKKNLMSSTPFDDIPEPTTEPTHITDDVPPSSTIASKDLVEEPLQKEEPFQDEADEWGSFNTKKSKKDKKKGKSGLSTPVEAMPDSAKGLEFPAEVSISASNENPVTEPVDEEWGSLPTQKSKKGKKGKSGLSTPIEETFEKSISIDEPAAKLDAKKDTLPISEKLDEFTTTLPEEPTQEPIDFDSFSAKKSKKDKKKNRKSGLSTPPEEISSPPAQESLEQQPESIPIEIVDESSKIDKTQAPISEEVAQENIDDEWSSLPSKKSKKDKNNRKSGISTPVEEVPEKLDVLPEEDVSVADTKSFEPAPEPVDEEWGSFSTSKKSKKDKKKNKPGTSTPFEAEPVMEQVAEAPEVVESSTREVVEEPADEWDPTSSRKSKKDKKKNKSGTSTPFETEPIVESSKSEEQVPEISEIAESFVRDIVEEPVDEWVSTPSKKSKKDKKKGKSGSSTPFEAEPEEQLPSTPKIEESREIVEEPVEEWAPTSSKKSKKDKKKSKSGTSTPFEQEAEEQLPSTPQFEESREIEEPADEWAPTHSKKSKKDKKKNKSGFSTPINDSFDTQEPEVSPEELTLAATRDDKPGELSSQENPLSTPTEKLSDRSLEIGLATAATGAIVAGIMHHDTPSTSSPPEGTEEPADEWGSYSTKKSKKDKKKRKSEISTPTEEPQEKGMPIEEPVKTEITSEPIPTEESPAKFAIQDVTENIAKQDTFESTVTENPPLEESPQEPEDEWGSVSVKKSKKDNKSKGKKGEKDESPVIEQQTSTPLAIVDDLPVSRDLDETAKVSEPPQELEDDFASFSTRKGKKDKKEKGKGKAVSDEPTLVESYMTTPPREDIVEEAKISEPSSSQDTPQEFEEEWGSTKKSKKDTKDKGKNKETLEPEIPIVSEQRSVTPPPQIVAAPALVEETSKEIEDVKEPEEEWGSFSQKKGKKDKKGKGKSKDNFDTPEAPVEPASIEETPKDNVDTKEPEEEFFSLKKSKKDKKGKGKNKETFDAPEPSIEPEQRPVTPPVEAGTEHALTEEISKDLPDTKEPEEEFGSFSLKKSKKDKKKQKSGISTPIEEPVVLDEPKSQKLETIDKSQPFYSEPAEIKPVVETTQDIPKDYFAFSAKKSKKDKKKQKSGISTPAEPIILDEPKSQDQELDTIDKSQPLYAEPAEIVETSQEVPDDEFAFTSKKSKKDKKNQESGLSTPAKAIVLNEPDLTSSARSATPAVETTQETLDDDFAFSSKKSKKDKKGTRGSRTDFITEAKEVSPSATPAQVDNLSAIEPSTIDPIISENVEDEKSREIPETIQPKEIGEDESTFGSLSRKGSKKDKRKRQASTVDTVMAEDTGSAKAPVTSWADDVEEAEVERELPVIEDIAVDESLSHIAKTTEATPVDDFVRPNKKGKKGKKGKSVDLSRLPVSFDPTKKEESKEESNVPIVAAVGAVVTGAALVGGMSGKKKVVEPVKEPETPTTPVRKLTKKEKRRQSIDKRAPSNDIFDDDALWEGADPKDFEEKDTQEADDGDDGFWSPPQQIEPTLTAETTFQEPTLSRDQTMLSEGGQASRHSMAPMERPLSPPDDMDFARTLAQQSTPRTPDPVSRDLSSHRSPAIDSLSVDKDTTFQESPIERSPLRSSQFRRSGFSDLPAVEEESPVDFDSEHHSIPHIVDSDNANRDSAFVTDSPIPKQGAFANNHEHVRDSGVHMRDYSPAAASRAPVSTSDAAISRLSWPAVDEETETVDLKSQKQRSATPVKDKRDEKSHRSHEFYVTKEEQKHDSDKKREEKSHRGHEFYVPKEDSVKNLFSSERSEEKRSKHHEERSRSSLDLLPSQRDKGDTHIDLHRTSTIHKPESETSNKYHDDKRSSIDLLPSQRAKEDTHSELHRTSTIHKHGHDTAELHHDEKRPRVDLLPSKRAKEDTPTRSVELTPTPSSRHRDKPVSRDITPTKSDKADKSYTSTLSEKTSSTRKPAEESIVQKRLKRFETPELPSPSRPKEDRPIVKQQRSQTPEVRTPSKPKEESYSELQHLGRPKAEQPQGISDSTIAAGVAIAGAAGLGFAAARQLSQEKRSSSAASQRSITNINRLRTPNRPESVNSNRSGTPPLRRSDRKVSGDLRSLSQRSQVDLAKEAELAALTSTSTADATNTPTPANPTANEGRVRAKEMADVYDGFGEGRMGSPRSPTRPHSMRRRQSMQVLDLESKVEQLAAENRMLAEAKAQAERTLQSSTSASSSLVEKDAEIDSLKRTLEWLTNEVGRLTEVNAGLTSANATIGHQQNERYSQLESQHARTSRELQEARDAHTGLTEGMEAIVIAQVKSASQEKDQEIAKLRAELEGTKKKIREMQAKILMSKTNDIDFLTVRDEDYFESTCEKLCLHVQQWVLRFSKFSDMRACRLTTEINNDKTIDRLDNAILDGSDVDSYLTDRVKRRDVFMSMTMTMVWEFIFTRYLFGMDREQRQKLKSLEKLLSEVGPATAVHQWRATTLTLLSKRESFVQQREQDTQAVVHAILETLSEILPPPSHLENQIEEQLRRVIKSAVDLSIEMRTQRAEYMMLPPLQPEYDANGDLASKVSFNAALMNERSGDTTSNETLEQQKAVVRIVLFPLVVKKGDDRGEGDEEIVVCPAQVLVAKSKRVRMMSPGRNLSKTSMQSSMPADYNDQDDEEL